MGHLGFVPKKSTLYGGVRAVGKTAPEALALWQKFQALEEAGAFAVECELIPADVMARDPRAHRTRLHLLGIRPERGRAVPVPERHLRRERADASARPRLRRPRGAAPSDRVGAGARTHRVPRRRPHRRLPVSDTRARRSQPPSSRAFSPRSTTQSPGDLTLGRSTIRVRPRRRTAPSPYRRPGPTGPCPGAARLARVVEATVGLPRQDWRRGRRGRHRAQEARMPLIEVSVIKDVFTPEQKHQIITKLTDALVEHRGREHAARDVVRRPRGGQR